MSQSQFSLSWSAFQSSFCSKLGIMQQNEEYVDMTIAADNYLVKVHKLVMAIASPYFRELINSAPCQHPVIFLTGISHKTLCYLLEYIYAGESLVPEENINAFLEAGKALHIKGLDNIVDTSTLSGTVIPKIQSHAGKHKNQVTQHSEVRTCIQDDSKTINIPAQAKKVFFTTKLESSSDCPESERIDCSEMEIAAVDEDLLQCEDNALPTEHTDISLAGPHEPATASLQSRPKMCAETDVRYTVSNRGALQLILNRYVYNLTNENRRGQRRWRCADYRDKKCKALLTTEGDVVVNRSFMHSHPFHDRRILKKLQDNMVYSAIADATAAQPSKISESQQDIEVDPDYNKSLDYQLS